MKLEFKLEAGEQLYQVKFDEWIESNRHVNLQLGGSIIETGAWEDDGLTLSFFSKRLVLRRPKYQLLALAKPSDLPWPNYAIILPQHEDKIPVLDLQEPDDEYRVTHNNGETNSLILDGDQQIYATRLTFGSDPALKKHKK
jgi:hypothetical protein